MFFLPSYILIKKNYIMILNLVSIPIRWLIRVSDVKDFKWNVEESDSERSGTKSYSLQATSATYLNIARLLITVGTFHLDN